MQAPPTFPSTIGTLTVGLRTGTGTNDGTDNNALSLCVNATTCYPLNLADVNDFRVGGYDTYHFTANIPRSAVTRVQIKSANGTDAFRPACLELRFDGEPVYCNGQLNMWLGNGTATGEAEQWTDPAGLHNACSTCATRQLTHGPMVGAVSDTEARLLVRTDASRRVEVQLDEAAAPGTPVAYSVVYPPATRDFTRVVTFPGLKPSTAYEARVLVDGVQATRKASFRTPTPPGAGGKFKFAFGSCAKDSAQPIFSMLRSRNLDLFLFVGDNHYGNTPDRDSLRWFYRSSWARAGRSELLSEASTLATWDDHDFVGNNTNSTSAGASTALSVFKEYWANPSYGTSATPGVFSTHRFGDAEFFLVDDRYHRAAPTAGSGSILGTAQTAWLVSALKASTATFKFIACGSLFGPGATESWYNERPAALTALYSAIKTNKIHGVVFLAGDIHKSLFQSHLAATTGAYRIPELVSSPLANGQTGQTCSAGPSGYSRSGCEINGDYVTEVEVDTSLADPQFTARMLDVNGALRDSWTVKRSSLEVP
ncbi:MAG: hypothetical protein RL653_1170 [Pseudomonadota bacterium]